MEYFHSLKWQKFTQRDRTNAQYSQTTNKLRHLHPSTWKSVPKNGTWKLNIYLIFLIPLWSKVSHQTRITWPIPSQKPVPFSLPRLSSPLATACPLVNDKLTSCGPPMKSSRLCQTWEDVQQTVREIKLLLTQLPAKQKVHLKTNFCHICLAFVFHGVINFTYQVSVVQRNYFALSHVWNVKNAIY